jgi:ribosomal protein L32
MSIRMRHTKGHSGNRRSHHALKKMTVVTDKVTGNLRLPHRLDEVSGNYRGIQVVIPKQKVAKGPKVRSEKHEHAHTEHVKDEGSKGVVGKIANAMRPKARSGAGGGGV